MKLLRMVAPLALIIGVSACGGGSSSPTTPTSTSQTRIIAVSGDLAFGDVDFGETPTRTFTIGNSGNSVLTFTGMNAVGGTGAAGYSATPTSGTVAPGALVTVTVRFTPTIAQFYSNVLTVMGDQTSGNAAINVSGTGVNNTPLFTRSGTGNTVFDMPTSVSRVHITGDYSGSCENFIVHIGGKSVVNEILGSCSVASGRHYDAIALTVGGVVEIVSSNGVSWSFTEVR